MNRIGFALVALAALAGTHAAHAEGPWYVSGSAGAYLRETASIDGVLRRGAVAASGTFEQEYDPGIVLNGAVGYRVGGGFRIEGELGYARYEPGDLRFTGRTTSVLDTHFSPASGGTRDRYMATLNGFYDLPVQWAAIPYVGVGVGFAHSESEDDRFVADGGGTLIVRNGSGDHGVALAEAGLSIPLNPSWAVVPAYRYIHFFANGSASGDEVAHVAKLGLRYSF